jgi:hypothetical protein
LLRFFSSWPVSALLSAKQSTVVSIPRRFLLYLFEFLNFRQNNMMVFFFVVFFLCVVSLVVIQCIYKVRANLILRNVITVS